MELGLKNAHVLLTGSSGGIGLETARMYLKEGARVSLHYSTQLAPLSDLLRDFPDHAHAIQATAEDEQSVKRALQSAYEKFGTVHIMIANHAIFPPESVSLKDMEVDQFRRTIDINLTGVFLFVREWLRQLERALEAQENLTNVNCVLVGSTAGIFGEAGHVDYSCSKSALTYGFCRSLKNELPQLVPNSRVNVVAPGWVLTPLAEKAIEKDASIIPKALQTVALKKIATPTDVANSILFLSSQAAGHISGCTLDVHGGMEGRCLNPL